MNLPTLSRFEVLGRLATGGMAEVWLARVQGAAGFEKLVVLKTILPQLAQNPTFVSMFINEGRLAAMLSHPNCVQVFDLGQEGDTLYLSMEYVEGFSLSRLLKRAKERGLPPPEKVLARIVMDAASGLDYAHKLKDREGRHLQLVHRDVSPDNLLISFSGQTKVVDFGIARAVTPAILAAATSAGTVKGKHGFIAPEYLLGFPVDHRADLFALGVVLYRALTRKRPFGGNNDAEISLAVINDTPRPPHEVAPDVGAALSSVVMMALAKDPKDRFESARALRQAVEVAVVRAAENEDVADYMNLLWPAGDEERVSLEALAKAGRADESSDPALRAFDSGTWSNPVATPARGAAAQPRADFVPPSERAPSFDVPLAGVHATPPTTEELTRQLLRPTGTNDATSAPAAPSFDPPQASSRQPVFADTPSFDPPQASSRQPVFAATPSFEPQTSSRQPVFADAPSFEPQASSRQPVFAATPSFEPQTSSRQPVFAATPSFEPRAAAPRAAAPQVSSTRRWLWGGLAVAVVSAVGLLALALQRDAQPAAPAVVVAQQPPPLTARVKLAPPVAVKVFEGKDELGTTPLERDFEPGPHALRLVNKAQGIDQALTLTLAAGDSVVIDNFAKGALVVKADPWAEVTVDGRALGVTPVTVKALLEGVHVVELKNAAFAARRLEVRVKGGETKTLNVDLSSE